MAEKNMHVYENIFEQLNFIFIGYIKSGVFNLKRPRDPPARFSDNPGTPIFIKAFIKNNNYHYYIIYCSKEQ